MPASRLRLLTVTLAAVVLSCQEAPDISSELTEYKSLVNDINGAACACPQDLGFSTLVECGEVYRAISPEQSQCLDDALVGSEEAAKDHLDCANTALQFYLQCLEANSSCDEGAYDDCRAAFDADIAVCPVLPSNVSSSFDACVARA